MSDLTILEFRPLRGEKSITGKNGLTLNMGRVDKKDGDKDP